jgi:uncharacterized surface protein with fasciclin (FAS1) repeats
MIKQVILVGLLSTMLANTGVLGNAQETYNNTNRFIRWNADNEYVLSIKNSEPFYGAKLLLEQKNDNNRNAQRWEYNPLTKQISGMNDFCVGVGGQYEIMLKDCVETLTHTIWNFDEMGRMVGSVNVTGVREAFCVEGEAVNEALEMKFVTCNENPTQKFSIEGAANTAYYNDIILYNDGQQQDSVFNRITTDQELETLRDIIQLIGVEPVLRNEQLSVFAPTDEAFAKLTPEVINILIKDENRDLLNEIIAYHVTENISAERLVKRGGVKSVTGDHLQLIDGKIDGYAALTQTDIIGRNGIVHKIDTVLIPEKTKQKIDTVLTSTQPVV